MFLSHYGWMETSEARENHALDSEFLSHYGWMGTVTMLS